MAYKTFHKEKYYITFKRGFEDCKKDVTVTIDKLFETDALVGFSILKLSNYNDIIKKVVNH